jgi:Ca-activated chloride channel family protein
MALLMVGMSFATLSGANDVLEPDVTKDLDPDEIYFGMGDKTTTVTIEVTGDGGTSTTITPMDVVFAIDSSGSMVWNDPDDDRLEAAKDFVDQMDDARDAGGVVSWDTNVDFTYGLSDDFSTLKDEIDNVDSNGGTILNVGLNAAIAMLDANTRVGTSVEVIIFLTDGVGTYTYSGNPGAPADDAASKGYIIYSIGFGGAASGPLEDMADTTGGDYYYSPTPQDLTEIYNAIYDEVTTSNIPNFVNVTEVLQDHIILVDDSFNIDPDDVTENLDGTTTIFWENVAQYVGNEDDALDADETVELTFDVWSGIYGMDLEVQVEGEAIVEYYDSDGAYVGYVDIPQAYLDVHPYVADLIAGGGNAKSAIDVGEVIIYNDEDYLYIKYVTEDGWYMTETHLHVAADSPDGIPQTKKGNPIPGQFDHIDYHNPAVQCVEYMIEWDEDWEPGTVLYIAAHAVVEKMVGYDMYGMPIYQEETAWGDGLEFEGKNWATYMEYEDP